MEKKLANGKDITTMEKNRLLEAMMMGKKQGCWKDLKRGRTLYFMGGKERKGRIAKMMCKGK